MKNGERRQHSKIIEAYCATCNRIYATEADLRDGIDRSTLAGRRFACPKAGTGDMHRASWVNDGFAKLWLAVEVKVLLFETRFSPMQWFKRWWGTPLGKADVYVFSRLIVLIVLAACIGALLKNGFAPGLLASALALVPMALTIDILISNTSIAFVSHAGTNPLRTALFTVVSFLSLPVAFASFYLACGNAFNEPLGLWSSLYFSFVTATTLGYGDIHPTLDGYVAQGFVLVQILVSFYFLALLVATNIDSLNNAYVIQKESRALEDFVENAGDNNAG